jgi:hypothetical protein
VELPVAEGCGLIVGRLRPGPAVDIDDYLGLGLADELALLDFADWEPAPRLRLQSRRSGGVFGSGCSGAATTAAFPLPPGWPDKTG